MFFKKNRLQHPIKQFRFLLVFVSALLMLSYIFLPLASRAAESCQVSEGAVLLSVPVPGMPLVYNAACNAYEFRGDGAGNLMVSYIKFLYKFLAGVAGIITVFMIMYGGVQWIFSGGNSAKINAAKETIFGAIIGLFLVLGSYLLLRTVNPQLTNLHLEVKVVNPGATGIHNADGSCVKAEKIPCGTVCQPLSDGVGEPMIGQCKFCELSGIPGESCGEMEKNSSAPVSEGNCVYSRCPDGEAKSANRACVYASEYDESLADYYLPDCEGSVPLTFSRAGNKQKKSFHFSSGYYGSGVCGRITYRDSGLLGEYGWIGNHCEGQATCVIDISKGATFTDSMENEALPLEQVIEVGSMNSATCKP